VTTTRKAPAFLESQAFFLAVLLFSIVVPLAIVVLALILKNVSFSLLVETLLIGGAALMLLAAGLLFDQDGVAPFFGRSVLLAYLVKYTAIPYALSALQGTIAFAMQLQDGRPLFQMAESEFLISNAFLPAILWTWAIAVASFLAGDARIAMIRRQRKTGQ